jgi:transcriptional regulator with XRE-family HTH domain
MRMIDRHIGDRIRTRRRCLGLTMAQLAACIGIAYQQLHKYETGTNHVSVERLYHLSLTLDVSTNYFFEGLSDERIISFKRADVSFINLASYFIRLSKCDQRIVIAVAHLFARGRASLATLDITARDRPSKAC